jgi:hypothetical protein
MVSRVSRVAIIEQERRIRALHASLQATLTEARLLRRALQMLEEARQALELELTRPRGPLPYLDLRHANRVF